MIAFFCELGTQATRTNSVMRVSCDSDDMLLALEQNEPKIRYSCNKTTLSETLREPPRWSAYNEIIAEAIWCDDVDQKRKTPATSA